MALVSQPSFADKNTRVRQWVFTLNNYEDPEDVDRLLTRFGESDVRFAIFGCEVGESGTPHLQGYVSFMNAKRLSECKKVIGDRAALFAAKGNEKQNIKYCSKGQQSKEEWEKLGALGPNYGKDAVVHEVGRRSESGGSKKSCKYAAFQETVKRLHDAGEEVSEKRMRQEHPEMTARFANWCRDVVMDNVPDKTVPIHKLRRWQKKLVDDLKEEPNARTVIFIVDLQGNAGKSYLAEYCESVDETNRTVIQSPDKIADMSYELIVNPRVVFLDCERSCSDMIEYLYKYIERLKNGRVFSPKYHSRVKRFNPPHVVVLMNQKPNMEKLSEDRYDVRVLTPYDKTVDDDESHERLPLGHLFSPPCLRPKDF